MTLRKGQRAGFGADTGGAIAVMTALLLPVLIGIAAYAVDASLLLYRQERLQIAADIGARAGAEMLVRGESDARAIAFAETMVAANMGANAGAVPSVTVTLPEPGRLSVDASLPVARIFSQLFGGDAVIVRAGSTAVFDLAASPAPCVYLDDPRTNRALRLRRDSTLSMAGCSLAVASTNGRAVTVDRGATLRTGCLDVAGDISGAERITLDGCAAPGIGVAVSPPADFARIAEARPRPNGGCSDTGGGKDKPTGRPTAGDGTPDRIRPINLHPSGMREIRFCKGLKVDRDTTGGPGLYFFEDDLEIADGATLVLGPGAVIVLQGKADIDIDTDAMLRVTPPSSGTFDGVAIMAGRDRDTDRKHDLDIGRIDAPGLLVFPGEKITLRGQNADAGCLRIFAGQLDIARNARITARCAGGGGGSGGGVALAPGR